MGAGNRAKGSSRPKPKGVKAATYNLSSSRRLSRFGKQQQRGKSGEVSLYFSRAKALKTLQITLRDFRRLCILKGIFPREPKKAPNKDKKKTYYHVKDISYLAHEPLLQKFRTFKSFMKKVRRKIAKKDHADAIRMYDKKPEYTLDHLVKERYPHFRDSLEDLDDALSLLHLFASLPSEGSIRVERTEACARLAKEWQLFVVKSGCLQKVFCSVKGMYYQCVVSGVTVTWIVPHKFAQNLPNDVDYRVMLTFLEFYQSLLGFVMFKLFHSIGLKYPPSLSQAKEDAGAYLEAFTPALLHDHAGVVTDDQSTDETKKKPAVDEKKFQNRLSSLPKALKQITKEPVRDASAASTDVESSNRLFSKLVFYVSREVPMETLHFCILAFGGKIVNETEGFGSAPSITHQVTDRTLSNTVMKSKHYKTREFVQPQWVFDCVNSQMLLPVARYHPHSKDLPPHLSPFVDDAREGYTPLYAEELQKLRAAKQASMAEHLGMKYDNTPAMTSLLARNNEQEEESSEDEEVEEDIEDEQEEKEEPEPPTTRKRKLKSAEIEPTEESTKTPTPTKSKKDAAQSKKIKQPAAPTFIPSKKFTGNKSGFVFRTGSQGLGYYSDTTKKQKITFVRGSKKSKRSQRLAQKAEDIERGKMMMSKKARRLYGRMQYGIEKKKGQVQKLKKKREQYDNNKRRKN